MTSDNITRGEIMWKREEDFTRIGIHSCSTKHEFVYLNWCGPHMAGVGVQLIPNFEFYKRITEGHHTYRVVLGFISFAFIYHPKYLLDGKKNAFHRKSVYDPLDQ